MIQIVLWFQDIKKKEKTYKGIGLTSQLGYFLAVWA